MPSAKILEQKKQIVAELTEKLQAAAAGVVVKYQGINTDEDTKLRKALREAGVEYKVYKNSAMARPLSLTPLKIPLLPQRSSRNMQIRLRLLKSKAALSTVKSLTLRRWKPLPLLLPSPFLYARSWAA